LVNEKEKNSLMATADDLPTLIKVLFQFKLSGKKEIDKWQ